MLPDLSLLIALLIGLQALGGAGESVGFTLGGVLASVLAGLALVRMAADRGVASVAEHDLEGAAVAARWTALWPLLAWALCTMVFAWGGFVGLHVPRLWWLVRYVVLFAPAAVLFAAGWIARSRIEGAVRTARGGLGLSVSPGEAVRAHARRNAIALVPLVAILAVVDGVYVLGEMGVPGVKTASRWIESMPLLGLAVSMALMTAAALYLPRVFQRLLRTEPLPAGEIRTLLERSAQAIRLRYRDLVVWRTGGRVMNAMVVGLTNRTRTIFLTDGLLERLPREEILAVFAHEAGHAKRHHLPLYLVVFFALALVFEAAGGPLLALGISPWALAALQLALLWFGMLGWLSRKFEREADVYGAEHAAVAVADAGPVLLPGAPRAVPFGASLMIRALDRIGRLTGHSHSMRHGSLEERIRYVAGHATDPEVRQAFRRGRRNLYVGIAALCVVAVVASVWQLPSNLRLAAATVLYDEATESYEAAIALEKAGSREGARPHWESALAAWEGAAGRLEGETDPRAAGIRLAVTFNAADTALHGLRDRARARPLLERVLALGPRSPSAEAEGVLVFQARIDLGRIAAGEGRIDEAREHLAAAEPILPVREGLEGAWFRARLGLLKAVIEAREGVPTARQDLLALAKAPRYDGNEWTELMEDARDELARLPRGP